MAQRDISNFRTVTDVVAKQEAPDAPSGISQLADTAAQIGQKIIAENQEAKINENFSMAQLELNQLSTQMQIDYESNPFEGAEKYKEARKKVLDKYGSEISPFFKKPWQTSARELGTRSDIEMQGWALKQTKVNTVKSINRSIKNNMIQATLDGQNFGNSDETEIGSLLKFQESRNKLASFGDQHIGEETTTEMLESYSDDYLKSFLSGVSESNPLKALRMLDSPEVKGSFRDQQQYSKMKEAIESRALNVQKINGEKQVLNTLKDENSLLTKSLVSPVSYAELQSEFDKTNMSVEARKFFMSANGYTKADGSASLNPAEQLQAKSELYENIIELTSREDVKSTDIAAFQDNIYKAMNNEVLNEKEGIDYINALVVPFVDKKEKSFQNYSQGSFFGLGDSIGFKGVQEIFDNDLAVPLPEIPEGKKPTAAQQSSIDFATSINNANKIKLYDYYMSALQEKAASYGVAIGDVPDLNKPQKTKLYAEAQAEAKRLYMVDENPALATLPDLPNQVFKNGQIIPGAAGARQIKPDISVTPKFETYAGSDGYLYRRYPDGQYERVGAAPRGAK